MWEGDALKQINQNLKFPSEIKRLTKSAIQTIHVYYIIIIEFNFFAALYIDEEREEFCTDVSQLK